MKKIVALFVVMLAFGVTANAQQRKPAKTAVKQEVSKELTVDEAAKKDLNALTGIATSLNDTQKKDFYNLFEYKHQTLRQDLSDERKADVYNSIEAKLKASLDPADIRKLEKNPAVMKQLTH